MVLPSVSRKCRLNIQTLADKFHGVQPEEFQCHDVIYWKLQIFSHGSFLIRVKKNGENSQGRKK